MSIFEYTIEITVVMLAFNLCSVKAWHYPNFPMSPAREPGQTAGDSPS